MVRLLEKLYLLRWNDIIHVFKFLLALIPAYYIRKDHPDLWLICDYEMEARDNPYWLFKYVKENYPQQEIIYAINKKSADYPRVASLGPTVQYGSLKHWIYYLAARKNISSQKGGKPNAAVCYALEVSGLLKNTRVFLQHGIIKDDLPYLYYKDTKMRLFVCSVPREYEYVKNNFGYPPGYVKMLGLCRYDNLFPVNGENYLLLMPTWRKWIAHTVLGSKESGKGFAETHFAIAWNNLLNSPSLHTFLEQQKMKFVFYLHRNMQKFAPYFKIDTRLGTVGTWPDFDCQQLLKGAKCLVTDYSSVAMDFAYMYKPVIYYQFDYDEFRHEHLGEGYYNYCKDGFGPVCTTEVDVIAKMAIIEANNYCLEKKYKKRVDDFFYFRDRQNCRRNYEAIKALE